MEAGSDAGSDASFLSSEPREAVTAGEEPLTVAERRELEELKRDVARCPAFADEIHQENAVDGEAMSFNWVTDTKDGLDPETIFRGTDPDMSSSEERNADAVALENVLGKAAGGGGRLRAAAPVYDGYVSMDSEETLPEMIRGSGRGSTQVRGSMRERGRGEAGEDRREGGRMEDGYEGDAMEDGKGAMRLPPRSDAPTPMKDGASSIIELEREDASRDTQMTMSGRGSMTVSGEGTGLESKLSVLATESIEEEESTPEKEFSSSSVLSRDKELLAPDDSGLESSFRERLHTHQVSLKEEGRLFVDKGDRRDIDNELWVQDERERVVTKGMTEEGAAAARLAMRDWRSDATLSCPCCFTTLAFDSIQHEVHEHLFAAAFVTCCRVDRSSRVDQEEAVDHGWPADSVPSLRRILCRRCGAHVAYRDPDRIYHFFNALPSSA